MFPTINLTYLPGVDFGVYASCIEIRQIQCKAVGNVGLALSFGETEPKIETFSLALMS